jgi:hypothetical protein
VFVGRHTCGQDLRDNGVRDHREAKVDRPGSCRVLQVIDLTQGKHKREDPVLVVQQDIPCHAALETTEGQCRTDGKAQGINCT